MKFGLENIKALVAYLGNPDRKYRTIHIAGTNGKGSTAAMLHRILSLAGYRAALYTSPHLVSFTERMRIGDDEIGHQEVISLADEVWQRTGAAGIALTFFEFITVMAFVYFARCRIDVAVVEVGLGGRLDATNLITPLVSVITTISKDHEAYLGPDEISIAREKGGIIKAGVPVVCGKISSEVADLLAKIARERGAPAFFLGRDFSFFLKNDGRFDYTSVKRHFSDLNLALSGRHQRGNAALVLAALELAEEKFPVSEVVIRQGLQTVRWAGRLEVMLEKPRVVLDGAHNPEGIRALVDELSASRGRGKIKLLFATMADKDWPIMLRALLPAVDEVVFTRVAMERSADPHELAQNVSESASGRVIPDSQSALRTLLDEAAAEDMIVVAGSLYLLGEVHPMLEEIAAAKKAGTQTSSNI